ncbi:coiled-coil-helix-coiled-coil-helix domain-containing protein 7 [Thalassophryne amazonica]|uniref:coiled-coil-helix-coiled-coil-helix domain-containing protein 7 n=1 Tax=Thalassophryne amazonica TaxID=390379 RepID=UPI0014718E15|nr:coiled-coil-helix-coiled-coil-helix domain-containing protein 7 [Thalassophryne amazonica]XP_034028489.1 coiled-coil-helix-coiled-coil-helix domain-containing protein 7 [Thalassophryne amazonica]
MNQSAASFRNEDTNPCLEETRASQKCLDTNNYNRTLCSNYFEQYKNCRKYWHSVMLQRRRTGVKPDMPTAAERRQILAAAVDRPY